MLRSDQFVVHPAHGRGTVLAIPLHLELEALTPGAAFTDRDVGFLGAFAVTLEPFVAAGVAVGAAKILLLLPHDDDGAVVLRPGRLSRFWDAPEELGVRDPVFSYPVDL